MKPALHSLASTAATAATAVALDRIIPALAVGLTAIAHVLSPEHARAEMERRTQS